MTLLDYWQDHAACIGEPPDWFFPPHGDSAGHVNNARAVCARCPVRLACLDYALDSHEHHGVWGGMTPRERTAERRRRARLTKQWGAA